MANLIFKASTRRGQRVLSMAQTYQGFELEDVYSSYSSAKFRAWDWCYSKYCLTDDADNFHISSHNSMCFTVAWNGLWNGKQAVFVETRDNSYIVLINE